MTTAAPQTTSSGAQVGAPSTVGKEQSGVATAETAAAAPLLDIANNRLSNTTACLPIVYGSVAVFLGKKADEYHTHRWTLYLRGPNDEDLSVCINKVVFQLHPSFAQPTRELLEPPFEVTETGWGEFEAQIRIIWKDPSEKATLVNHGIKLYPVGSTNMVPTKEPVVAEKYDECVFTEPKESFFQLLMRVTDAPKILSADEAVRACFQTFSEEDDFQKLLAAQNFLQKELLQVKNRMKLVSADLEQVDQALKETAQQASANRGSVAAQKHKAAGVPLGGVSKKPKVG